MSTLQKLQDWYKIHCNNDWEHDERIAIYNLDNPGWLVNIDFSSTILEGISFTPIKYGNSEQRIEDWIDCYVNDDIFVGAGSCNMLEKIISIFLQWAENNTDTKPWDKTVSDLMAKCEQFHQTSDFPNIEQLRSIYFQINEIPDEHPLKVKLSQKFQSLWDEAIRCTCQETEALGNTSSKVKGT